MALSLAGNVMGEERVSISTAIVLILALVVARGCSHAPDTTQQPPVAIAEGDISAADGMLIAPYPGPRAEAYVQGYREPLKFGTTRDLFGYALQPENQPKLQSLYVQDTTRIDWQHPSGAASTFVNARTAYYVAWQPLPGMMGPTFAAFEKRDAAARFVQEHGGEVLPFAAVTAELTARLGYRCPDQGTADTELARDCVVKDSAAAGQASAPEGALQDP